MNAFLHIFNPSPLSPPFSFSPKGKRPVKLQLLIHSISLWAEREEKIEGEEEEREKRGKGEEGEERKGHRIRNRILILMDEKDIGS